MTETGPGRLLNPSTRSVGSLIQCLCRALSTAAVCPACWCGVQGCSASLGRHWAGSPVRQLTGAVQPGVGCPVLTIRVRQCPVLYSGQPSFMGWIKSAGEADFHLVGSTDSPPAVWEEREEEERGRGEEEKEGKGRTEGKGKISSI